MTKHLPLMLKIAKEEGLEAATHFDSSRVVPDVKENPRKKSAAYIDHADRRLMREVGMTACAIEVYQYLFDKAPENIIPAVEDIQTDTGYSQAMIKKARTQLANKGYTYKFSVRKRGYSSTTVILGPIGTLRRRYSDALDELREKHGADEITALLENNPLQVDIMVQGTEPMEIYEKITSAADNAGHIVDGYRLKK